MSGALVISSYMVFTILIILFSNRYYKLNCINRLSSSRQLKLPYLAVLLFAILFVLIDFFGTYGKTIREFGGDRFNYYRMFIGAGGDSLTYGLSKIFDFVRLYSNDIRSVFYLTSFVGFALLFYAYSISEDATPRALTFILLTDIAFVFFINIKQAYAVAISFLLFTVTLKKNTSRRTVFCILLIVLACLFHPSALILIPSYILIKLSLQLNRKSTQILFVMLAIMMLILTFWGDSIVATLAGIVARISSGYSMKILGYLGGKTEQISDTTTLAFIKGFPFYYVSIMGFFKRSGLRQTIKNYDQYLILSVIGSIIYLSCIHSYWLFRATTYFYYPIGIYFGLIVKNLNSVRVKIGSAMMTDLHSLIVYISEGIILIRYMLLVFLVRYNGF